MTVVRMHRPADPIADEAPPDHYPPAEHLAALEPFLRYLVYAAIDYDANAEDGEPTTAVEFVAWLKVDIERAAANRNLIHTGRNRTG